MEKNRRKELREQYGSRHPDMGIVSFRCGESLWAAVSLDAHADYNGTLFQLKLGSWPNREMQRAYTAHPEDFVWETSLLEYDDPTEDHHDDLELLLEEFLEEHPSARPMRGSSYFRH